MAFAYSHSGTQLVSGGVKCKVLERDFVIERITFEGVIAECLLVAGWCAVGWCLGIDFRGCDEQDGVCDDLCGGVFDAVLFVAVISYPAFDVCGRAFMQVFAAVVGGFVKDSDVVPVGLFIVAVACIGGQRECADRLAGLCGFALGIASEPTDEHDFVEHGLTSQVMFDGCFCLNPSVTDGGGIAIIGELSEHGLLFVRWTATVGFFHLDE